MIRNSLLWLSEQQQIFNFVRRNGLAKRFASRFVAGETIPEAVAARIPAACDLLARKEAVILEMARAPGFNVAKLKDALAKQDEIH